MAMGKKEIKIVWTGGVAGSGKLEGEYLKTELAIPRSYKGSGEGSEPMELLVSAAATCYIATLTSILENRKLPVEDVTMDSEIEASKEGMKITHVPQIALSADATEEQRQAAEKAMELADKACTVGNLLKKAGAEIDIRGLVLNR